jgi:hypothetical protein
MSSRDSEELEDELQSEIDDDFDELRSDKDDEDKLVASASKLGRGRLLPFDPVNVPKGDKTKFERFVSFRLVGQTEELLVKYKVSQSLT